MRNFAKRLALQLLRAYKWAISPMFPPSCRYVPTCSEYAMEAIEGYGVVRGGWMACARLLRCHPLCQEGHDFSRAVTGSNDFRALAPEGRTGLDSSATL